MRYDWILDVLTDLRAFAEGNGLSLLVAQLDDTARVARAEIARLDEGRPREHGAAEIPDPARAAGEGT